MRVLGVVTAVAIAAINGQSCKKITDADAPLRGISKVMTDINYDATVAMVKPVLDILPSSVEQCLANYNGVRLADILPTIIGSTCPKVPNVMKLKEVKDLTDALPAFDQDWQALIKDLNGFLQFLLDAPNTSYQPICNAVATDLVPCVDTVVPVLLPSLKKHSSGCCDDMFAQAKTNFGQDAVKLIPEIIKMLQKSICSTRNPGFTDVKDQTCAYTFIQVFVEPNVIKTFNTVLTAAQIPNKEGCSSLEGETFTTSGDVQATLGDKVKGRVLSGCGAPLDALTSKIAAMPIMATSDTWGALFQDGKCVAGSVVADALSALPLPDAALNVIKGLMAKACFHFANGYSSKCDFTAKAEFDEPDNGNGGKDSKDDDDDDEDKPDDGSASVPTTSLITVLGMLIAAMHFI